MRKTILTLLLIFLLANAKIIQVDDQYEQEDPVDDSGTDSQNNQDLDQDQQDDDPQGPFDDDSGADDQDDDSQDSQQPDTDQQPNDSQDDNDEDDQNKPDDPQPNTDSTNSANRQSIRKAFQEFKTKYNRRYSPQLQITKYSIFISNYLRILRNNGNNSRSYTLGVTEFADLTLRQFQAHHLMHNLASMSRRQGTPMKAPVGFKPKAVDWIEYITPAKNQGECGSCYAFSVTAAVEGRYFIKGKNRILAFSQQHLVDCCGMTGLECGGCDGTWPGNTLDYYAKAGVATAENYPYNGIHHRCRMDVKTNKIISSKIPFYQTKTTLDLAYALTTGPVSVTVDANTWDPLYKGGLWTKCAANTNQWTHAVTLVKRKKDGIWVCRNSWGNDWGDEGNIQLPSGNTCGIADWAVVPNLA